MSEASRKLRWFIQNPIQAVQSLHREYGLDQKEFSKILIITSAALLVVSIHASTTLGGVQDTLHQTDQQMQEASAVINSESFQQAMQTLQRVQVPGVQSQIETARNSFQAASESFENISQAEQQVGETRRMYQWMSLISILGIVTGVALRFM